MRILSRKVCYYVLLRAKNKIVREKREVWITLKKVFTNYFLTKLFLRHCSHFALNFYSRRVNNFLFNILRERFDIFCASPAV